MTEQLCDTCRANPAVIKGECRTCYRYRLRWKGKQRPPELASRQPMLNYKNFHRRG